MSSDVAIEVNDLSKCYHIYDKPHFRLMQMMARKKKYFREFWALNSVSFTVRKGESVGVIGRNGSGKSTLLQLICGTLTPTSGSVTTNGRIAALLELGSGFNPEFTGRENVFMNGAILGLSTKEIEARYDEIAAFADIGEFINQPTKTYSSGMLVRLAFAVQVCIEPDILIIDEALAVGDALFQKRCFERMERLTSNGTTLLFVSHDQESVRTLTHRAVYLKSGRVQMIGSSAEALLEYRKQLHEEENVALQHAALQLKARSAQTKTALPPLSNGDPTSPANPRTNGLSFGSMDAEVLKVELLSKDNEPCSYFEPRQTIRIAVDCIAHTDLSNLNVAIRIRNKEGFKLYSWGTLNQDMAIIAGISQGDIFWSKSFKANETFTVFFEFICGLGLNLYEIQASISYEGKPYYAEQKMLHWIDEAAFFTVTTNQREYHFGGAADLRMTSSW